MNTLHMKACAWGGIAFLILFFIGMVPFADFIPPHAPSTSAEDIAAIYQNNALSIRLGLVFIMIGIAFVVPFTAAIYMQLRTLEGRHNVLSCTTFISSIVIVALLYVVVTAWATAGFRPEKAAEITQVFNDFAWIAIIWITSILLTLYIPFGLLVLSDKRQQPLFPRWYGFYCFWVALLTFAGAFLIFFKTGPFAWDGLIAFWIPAFNFFPWYFITSVVLLKSIGHPSVTQLQTTDSYHAEHLV